MDKQQLAQSAAQAVDADELVRLTQALVRIASYYPGPGEQPVVDFLEAYLRGRGFKTTVQAVAPGRPNLIADLGQGAGALFWRAIPMWSRTAAWINGRSPLRGPNRGRQNLRARGL